MGGLLFSCTKITENLREYKIRVANTSLLTSLDYALCTLSATCIITPFLNSGTIGLNFPAFIFSLICLIHIMTRLQSIIEESILVIRDTGVQLTKKYYNGKEKHIFIDKTHINAILINEGASRFSFIFYLAFKIQGSDKLILAFEDLIPRINVLLQIFHGTRSIMFGEPED